MVTIEQLRQLAPISVIIDAYISMDEQVRRLEESIHYGDLLELSELENRVKVLMDSIEEFPGKEFFEPSYIKRMRMLVRTKQILASE